jgi:peptide/nickel transport system substrate-binding protein
MRLRSLSLLVMVVLMAVLSVSAVGAQDAERPVVMYSLVELYTIDPAVGFDQAIGSTLKQVYDSLFRYVGNPPTVQPWLADSYTVSDDGKTYTVALRQDAVFQDGSPVNADAVVYSAERLLRVGQGAAGLFTGVLSPGGTTAVDANTVQFVLNQPYGPFLDILTWLFIVNPAVVEANKGDDDGVTYLTNASAGSGPYMISNWLPGESYEFTANPGYWRGWPNENYATKVTRVVTRESSTRRLGIESGEADFVDWMSVDDAVALDGVNGIMGAPGPTLTVYDVKMNTVDGPTADVNLRHAIAYATDYDAMLAIWGGRGSRLAGPLPPSLSGDAQPMYNRDLDKAREALAASAYPDGTALEYVYVTGLEDERRTGLVLQDSLKEIGIDVTITAVGWADAVATFADPTTAPDLFPLYSGTAFADPDNYLWASFHSSLAGNWTNPGHYGNPAVDALLEQARATVDAATRTDLYNQAVAAILADSPNLFLATTPEDHIVGPRITNYAAVYSPVMGSMEDFYFFAVGG